jgi:hypothetical protein
VKDTWYDVGELPQLLSRLLPQGSGITLTPVLRETDRYFGGLNASETVLTLDHWEIKYTYDGTEEVAVGRTLREAVAEALADLNRKAALEH